MSSRGEIVRLVEERAQGRCEYCQMHQSLQGATFHLEHIVPSSRGGASDPENLAWCCPGCNLRKSDRIEAPDPETGELVPLLNPRRSAWPAHFRWDGYFLVGESAVGRATVLLLDLNHPRRLLIRQAEELFGLFPP
jgi:HNH endonuclease